ncbi:hypothetical protein C8R46DRAFT_1353801 [Mycena filopes]|nr:hypothetical protein C8R46DRAFT_1353801 [Mycena filopes]
MAGPLKLDADRALFAAITAEISTLERNLSLLRADHLQIQQLDSYKYPVLTLPNEIVSEIFLQSIPPSPDFPPLTGPCSPTILTQICRHWREITITTPALWRAISIYIDRSSLTALEDRTARSWLDRSRCLPLRIKMNDNGWSGLILQCATVIEQCPRWEHVQVHLCGATLQNFGGPMPLLCHLHVELGEGHPVLDAPAFPDVPLLRSAILDEFAALRISLPWSQLTSLTLRHCLLSTSSPILQHASNLIHCGLNLLHDGLINHVEPNKTLPHLRSLTLSIYPGSRYLETFTVPALTTLYITESLLLPDPVASLTSFIQNSRCQLEEVCIMNSSSTTRTTCTEAFPSVRFLSNGDKN